MAYLARIASRPRPAQPIRPRRALAASAGASILAILLAAGVVACGGDDDAAETGCAETPGSKQDVTVIVAELGEVGEALALADCTPVYANNVDTPKRIRCTGECARVWVPLTLPKGGSVTTQTPDPVGTVTFVRRPDGRQQAVLNGELLYTYAEEGEVGANGDGVVDNFGGTEFSWSVISPAEAAPEGGVAQPQAGGGQPAP